MTDVLLYLVAALLGLVALYVVIRLAVVHALRAVAVWQARGGVDKVLADETFARTGIRPRSE